MRVASVVARQLLDCKARPLVEVEITPTPAMSVAARRPRIAATR